MAETKRERLTSLRKQILKDRKADWDPHYEDLSNYILPRRSRFMTSDHNKGQKKHQFIINNTGTRAARTLRAGMHSGSTNPARPWFRLSTPDPDLMEFAAVKQWLYIVERRMRDAFLKSNLYNALPVLYGDLGVFGTGAMAFLEDPKDGMRFYTYPIGSYGLATNERNQVDTIARDLRLTVRQIVTRFGRASDKKSGSVDWSNFSDNVKRLWDQGKYEQTLDIVHIVHPNVDANPNMLEAKYKPFQSIYYETGNDRQDRFLRESGFDEFPLMGPRWEVLGDDVYGSSPGMEALGDIKALQVLEKRKAEAHEKHVRPPMTGPSSLRNQKASILPGDITYLDVRDQQQGFRPTYEVQPNTKGTILDINEHERRISSTFYEDLFLMLANTDRRQITAREVEERHEEKLLMLGPVLERMYDELHDPLISRAFNIMEKQGMFPPPPPELANIELKVEYISIMAQAQKAVATASIDQFAGFVGRVAEAQAAFGMTPEAIDKFDVDQAIDDYGDFVGVPPHLVRSDEKVQKIRDQRAQAQQRAAQAQQMQQAAETAKTASQADTQNKNALTDVLRGNGG